jgi:hypothetical protein
MKRNFLLGAFFLCYLTAATAEDNKAATENKISDGEITVSARNDEWTTTDKKISVGDIILTLATNNKITVGAFLGKAGANGIADGVGSLQMKIGTGAAQTIGEKSFVIASETGKLKLKIYDTDYRDNSGEYKVVIIHIPKEMMPTEQSIKAE